MFMKVRAYLMKIVLQNHPKSNFKETLIKAKLLTGRKNGVIQSIFEEDSELLWHNVFHYSAALTNVLHFSPECWDRYSSSTSTNKNLAKARSIGEAIERYCLSVYDENDFILSNYAKIKKEAINPSDFGLFSETQYSKNNFNISRFSVYNKLHWVWGYSLMKEKPVLLPACFVFVPYKVKNEVFFIRESISTGAACGNTIEEAILSGIYEVVERDAFMIWWLNKLKMPRIDLSTVKNRENTELIAFFSTNEFQLEVVNITTDIKIPTFVSMLINKMGNEPLFILSANTCLDPNMCLLGAMEELFQGYNSVMRTFKEYKNYPYISQFNDVKTSNDHILLYTRKEPILNLDFVLNFVENAYIQDFNEIENNSSENVLGDIKTCVEIFKKKDIDILIVDITKSDVAEAGFSVVKVIIPGMQPLNIDHNYPYLGIKRLYEVPKILGYTQHTTREDDLNKFPHPFP